jgi:hypothetical protein
LPQSAAAIHHDFHETQALQSISSSGLESMMRAHIGLVYASALRQVCDPHAAADVTQAVSLILQQKHEKLGRDRLLERHARTRAGHSCRANVAARLRLRKA